MKRQTIIERKARRGISPYVNDGLEVPPWAIECARYSHARKEFRDQLIFFATVAAVIMGAFMALFLFAEHWV